MALRIRFQYDTGSNLGYSIERLADGLLLDSDGTFKAAPASPIARLPEDSHPFQGRYKLTLDTPIAQWPNGDYVATVHNQADNDLVVAELGTSIFAGDDAWPGPQPVPQFNITFPAGIVGVATPVAPAAPPAKGS